ncbi:2-keto-4-pentenoate hydratase [Xanthomonas arboricola]|uniref:fumarylacetoacetate hydrolase family protein n=1 Tax=Xanthomonas arboricola TaxID=56448 RepID=UPI00061A2DCE|nr:fumarylacetoacetate hydrolase family protein [Xanthomonas arboricola]AKC80637.1 2-keto-4-pentenoate hydratase [Xanthomonas arboricola]
MKFQLFSYAHGSAPMAGIVVDDHWLDLGELAALSGEADLAGCSIDTLVEEWDAVFPRLHALATRVEALLAGCNLTELAPTSLSLLAPLTRPGAIYGAGANYRDHVEAMSRAFNMKLVLDPKSEGVPPWHFLKAGKANVIGHAQDVPYPAGTQKLDWEAELAVVIGRYCRAVSVDEALDYVAGYSCANDLSARDHLVRPAVDASSPFRFDWIGHKCFEGSCPLGPLLTPAAFVETPEDLDIRLWVNDELKQDSNTSNHLYGVAEQIAYLSTHMALHPGDIILTGTPAGVGMESGVFLQRGDTVRVWIDGLGELRNRIVG